MYLLLQIPAKFSSLKKSSSKEAVSKNGKPPIKRGDKITIRFGYDDLEKRFTGFILSVDAQVLAYG